MHEISMDIVRSARSLALMLILVSIGAATAQVSPQRADDPRIERVLSGLRPEIAIKGQPPERWTLAEEMRQSHIPGISIVLIDKDEIAWARGVGVKEVGRNDPVTTSTLFEAQSISKAITATATLVLVNSGRLSLEESPNTYLKS